MSQPVEWRVTCDGSAVSVADAERGFPGGWAAVVEHGSDGWAVQGGVAGTTSTRMEIVAAARGLREVPRGVDVVLVSDCSIVWAIHDRWTDGRMPISHRREKRGQLPKDIDVWMELVAQFGRLGQVDVLDVTRKQMDPVHRRCHGMANAQARKVAQDFGYTTKHLSRAEQEERARARREARRRSLEVERHRLARRSQPGFPKIADALSGR